MPFSESATLVWTLDLCGHHGTRSRDQRVGDGMPKAVQRARIAERHKASQTLRAVVRGSSAQSKAGSCEKEVERNCDHGY